MSMTFWMTWPPRATMTTSTRVDAERDELDAIEHRRLVRRPEREADVPRRLRHARATTCEQQRVEQAVGAVAPQPRFDRARRPARTASIRAAGRRRSGSRDRSGMRPAEVCGCWTKPSSSSRARMLRTVADDTPSPAAVDQQGRGNRFARRDVLAHQRGEHALRPYLWRLVSFSSWQSLQRTAKSLYTDAVELSRRI